VKVLVVKPVAIVPLRGVPQPRDDDDGSLVFVRCILIMRRLLDVFVRVQVEIGIDVDDLAMKLDLTEAS